MLYTPCSVSSHLQQVFRCFGSWLRFAKVPYEVLLNNPLVMASFDAINSSSLFETVVDVICEIIRLTESVSSKKAKQQNKQEGIIRFTTGRRVM